MEVVRNQRLSQMHRISRVDEVIFGFKDDDYLSLSLLKLLFWKRIRINRKLLADQCNYLDNTKQRREKWKMRGWKTVVDFWRTTIESKFSLSRRNLIFLLPVQQRDKVSRRSSEDNSISTYSKHSNTVKVSKRRNPARTRNTPGNILQI